MVSTHEWTHPLVYVNLLGNSLEEVVHPVLKFYKLEVVCLVQFPAFLEDAALMLPTALDRLFVLLTGTFFRILSFLV